MSKILTREEVIEALKKPEEVFNFNKDRTTLYCNHWTPTSLGRCANLNLVQPSRKYNKHGLKILMDKENKENLEKMKIIQLYSKAAMSMLYGVKKPVIKYNFLRDGDSDDGLTKTGDRLEGHEGNFFIVASARTKEEFKILDGRLDSDFKAGMIVRAMVKLGLGESGFFYQLKALRLVKDDGVRFKTNTVDVEEMMSGMDEAVEVVNKNGNNAGDSLAAAYDKAMSGEEADLDVLG